ncbi:MAG TPA: hypothetical protein DDZ22_16675, partial [Massilia sp.]|nr:hypothetical protein [Massilia sp.]
MALATQCPHCGTMFRVASDQLKLRGGIVRCGACQEIFDGSASLVDLDALPRAPAAPTPPPAVVEAPAALDVPAVPESPAEADVTATADTSSETETPAAVAPELKSEPEPATDTATDPLSIPVIDAEAPAAPADDAAPNFDDQPVYTLDFGHTFDPFGILPKVAAPEENSPVTPEAEALSADAPVTKVTVVEPPAPADVDSVTQADFDSTTSSDTAAGDTTSGDTAQVLTPPAFAPAT